MPNQDAIENQHQRETENETLHASTDIESEEKRDKKGPKPKELRWEERFLHFCKSMLIRYYNTNYFASLTIGIFTLITSILTWNNTIFLEYIQDETVKETKCGVVLLLASSFIIPYILLSLFIKWITTYVQYKKKRFSYNLYATKNVASNISFTVVTVLVLMTSIKFRYQCRVINQLDLKINSHDVLMILLFGNLLLTVISAFVCNISFNFNRDTLIDRMLIVFKVDYFIRLLKIIRAYNIRSTQVPKNKFWEYAFPWATAREDYMEDADDEHANKKHLFFTTNLSAITPFLRNWVYAEFKKQPMDIIYTTNSEQIIDIENKKIPKNLRKLTNLSSFGINNVLDLQQYFKDKEQFDSFCAVMNFTSATDFSEEFITGIIKRNIAEKRYIHLSLNQINGALTRIKHSVFAIVITLIIIYTAILSYGNHQMILAVVSTFFGTGYAFQSSVKNAIDNIIFLLCIHPFDVGDRVLISLDSVQQNLVVQEMNVFSTIFTKFDGTQTYVPNTKLATKQIVNISRSGYMIETQRLTINTKSNCDSINNLQADIDKFIKGNSCDYTGFYMLYIDKIDSPNKMHLSVMVQFKRNWHNYFGYLEVRGTFLEFLRERLDHYKLDYIMPHQPVSITRATKVKV